MIILDEYLTMRDITTQFWDTGATAAADGGGGEFKLFFRMYRAIP